MREKPGEDQGVNETGSAPVAEVIGAVAAFESRQIGDRTSSALRVLKGQGKRLGRPSELDRQVAERVVALKEEGLTFRAIAHQMEADGVATATKKTKWHPSTVQQVLRTVELDSEASEPVRA